MGALTGKAAIVVGASTGIGRASALAMAAEGCRVLGAARNEEALSRVAAEASAAGGEVVAMRVDVTKKAEVEAMVAAAVERFGRVDVLVNSSGANTPKRALAVIPDEEWHRIVNTNLNGAYNLTKAVLPQMRRQGGGQIIHINSLSGRWPSFAGAAYQATKNGLTGLAHATTIEERAHGIRASLIFPGVCDTPFLRLRPKPPDEETRAKMMKPEDVAAAVVFVASLPPRTFVPELFIMPLALQCIGQAIA